MPTYHSKRPAILASDLGILCIEDTDLQTPCDEGNDYLKRVKTQFQVWDDIGINVEPHGWILM
jgi:hypothetical protein